MTGEAGFPAVYTPASSRQGGPDTSLENRHYSSQLFLLGERYTSKVMICKAICENMVDVALTQIGVVLPGISLYHPGIMPIAGTEETWLPQSLSHAVAAKRRCSSGKIPSGYCQTLPVGSVLTESLSVGIAWHCSQRKIGIGVPGRLWHSESLRSPC
jgi:hypothetical protein